MKKNAAGLERPHGINHVAYRCRDAEQTRWFYEDVLGLALVTGFSILGASARASASPPR